MCAGTMRESREGWRETTRQTVSRFLKIADKSFDNRRLRFVCLIQTFKSWGVISWYLCTLQRPLPGNYMCVLSWLNLYRSSNKDRVRRTKIA